MILLLIGLHRVVLIFFLRGEGVNVSELEETQVLTLTVHIVLDALKTTIQQCLTHHVQIGREGIHDSY